MVRSFVLATMLFAFAASSLCAQDWARNMFEVTSHDFGTVARGSNTDFSFKLKNKYVEDVHIAGVRSSCGCTTPKITNPTLKSLEEGAIVTTYNTNSFLGSKNATITVTFDKPYYAEVQLTVKGFIRGDVVFNPGTVDFGTVNQGSTAQQSVSLSYAGRSDWKIVDVRSGSSNFEVDLTETSRSNSRVDYQMTVYLKNSVPAGYFQDEISIITSDSENRTIPLTVQGRVASPLTVSPGSLFLGVLQPGQVVTKTLIVRGKQPFQIVDVKCDGAGFEFKRTTEAKLLHVIPVTFTAGRVAEKLSHTIEIQTDLASGGTASCIATATIKSGE